MGVKRDTLKKKEQNPHQILHTQGSKLENKDELLKVYARYYKELLILRPAENMEEEGIERKVDNEFQEIIAEKTDQIITTTTEITKSIEEMKSKNVAEHNNWKAERIKREGTKWYRVS